MRVAFENQLPPHWPHDDSVESAGMLSVGLAALDDGADSVLDS